MIKDTRIFKKYSIGDILKNYSALIILVFLFILMIFLSPNFLTFRNIINLIRQVSVLAILAYGSTFVLISGEFDISIGALAGLAGVLVVGQINIGNSVWSSILIVLLIGTSIGSVNGLIVTKLKINAFITTLGTMLIIRGFANVYTGGTMIQLRVDNWFPFIGRGLIIGIPIIVIVMILLGILSQIVLTKSRIGRIIYSVGANPVAARFSGINVEMYKIISFSIGGLFAAIGGVALSSRLGIVDASVAIGYEFDAITAVVLGGTSLFGGKGNIHLTVLGALIMGIVRNGMNLLLVETQLQSIVTGLIFIGAVALSSIKQEK